MHRALVSLAIIVLAGFAQARKDRDGDKTPWFCHDRDCPRFKTMREWGSFSIRRYTSSVWAAVCLRGAQHEEALWRGTAELMNYIKGDNDNETALWGGTPFAHHVSLSEEQLDAWNASAHNQPSLEWLHKTVCVAYYLPEKYQGNTRPPKPSNDAVRIVRVPRWIAYVSGFDGFPTKWRVIREYIGLVRLLKIHCVPFNWRVAVGFVYDPPFVTEDRHNEVLVPARRLDELFGQDAKDIFADEKRMLPVKTTAVRAFEGTLEDSQLAAELAVEVAEGTPEEPAAQA